MVKSGHNVFIMSLNAGCKGHYTIYWMNNTVDSLAMSI